jgi:O-antigen/teichoic acid export membrane protein
VPLGYVLLGAIALPAMIFNRLSSLTLTACGRVRQASIISAAGSLLSLALLSAFLLVVRLDVWGAILAASLASCSVTLITLLWLRFHLRAQLILRPALWGASIRFGSKLHVGTIAQWLNYSLDRFLINVFLGPGAVGVYAVAATLGERLWMLPGAVGASLLCRTGGNLTNDADVTAHACRNTFWLMCGGCAAVAALAPALIPVVFGHDFAAASWVLLLLLPGVLMLTLGKVIAPYVCNRGRPAAATYISVGALGLTVALNLLLIPLLGIAGAAVASSISYSANGIAFAVVFLRMSRVSPRQLVGLPQVDVRRLSARCTRWLSTAIARVCYDGST